MNAVFSWIPRFFIDAMKNIMDSLTWLWWHARLAVNIFRKMIMKIVRFIITTDVKGVSDCETWSLKYYNTEGEKNHEAFHLQLLRFFLFYRLVKATDDFYTPSVIIMSLFTFLMIGLFLLTYKILVLYILKCLLFIVSCTVICVYTFSQYGGNIR